MNKPTAAANPGSRFSINEFPILEHGLYANHAAISPWPRVTAQAVMDFAGENCQTGAENYPRWLIRESELRERLAGLLNAESANDIALLKNTTEGICTVAAGIRWQTGDNLVLPADEFPSNRLPWMALKERGVEVREVDIHKIAEPERALIERMDKRTRLVAVSAVRWTDGLRLRLEMLGQTCRRNGVLFFVDAIQQLGAIPMDVRSSGIDFLAADGHKWLLAPEGIAVFYCRRGVRGQLQLNQQGWRMVDEPYHFNRDHWQPSDTARRFEAGSPNTLGQAALHASLGLLMDVGMQNVEALVTANTKTLSEGLGVIKGVELVRTFNARTASGIVSFTVPDRNPVKILHALKQRQLTCAVRGKAIRLSPHFYQHGEPVLQILNVIEDTIKDNLL